MSKKEYRHYYLASGHVTSAIKFDKEGKIVEEVNTFPVQAFLTTDKEDTIPMKYVALAQKALQNAYEERLPKGQDVMHQILDVQVHNLMDLGHMTEEEFFEDMPKN